MRLSLLAIGECMVELSLKETGETNLSFAGDTYNSLVYAKRWVANLECSIFTAIGSDQFSHLMQARWTSFGIDSSLVLKSEQNNVGIYAIQTDESGERKFDYWRKNSAATTMMQLHDVNSEVNDWPDFDVVYFSGISLAILSEADKQLFFNLIANLQYKGSKIAFDPNYRASMWQSKEHAVKWLKVAYQHSDIVLPGTEDHKDLLGHTSVEDIVNYCLDHKVEEVVVKAGSEGVYGFKKGVLESHQAFKPAPVQVDTTAAGDSFAGVYLACRIRGDNIENSLIQAADVAGVVVQHHGAIIDQSAFDHIARTCS